MSPLNKEQVQDGLLATIEYQAYHNNGLALNRANQTKTKICYGCRAGEEYTKNINGSRDDMNSLNSLEADFSSNSSETRYFRYVSKQYRLGGNRHTA